jgi:ABC-2 type transport system ATP-binding protein
MKQKLLIAIALGREAKVLVMDEPAANLDPEARKIFFDLLAERQNDATMIISSHRLDEVSALVNRVIEMDMGKVVLDDKVADDVSLTATLACRIVSNRFEPAFAKAIDAWKFTGRRQPGLGRQYRRSGSPALPRHGGALHGAGQRHVR